ncbi:type I pullulanase [Oceanobacillus massiliensis]|uniref:type I pullulanase n=2 Tax=Oceanobacillus massiliensis TaxID=1465765 RepID=UPI0002894A03|nr:type I pullulanase [Oceanobacillus massiliensis]
MEKHTAWIDDVHYVTVTVNNLNNFIDHNKELFLFSEKEQKKYSLSVHDIINESTVQLELAEEFPIGEELTLRWGEMAIPVYPRAVVRTPWFDARFSAMEMSFGATCTMESTTFSVWAPTAASMKLYLDNESYKLNRNAKGVWCLEVKGDWHGCPYEYEATINGTTKRVNDPYAKGMLANSEKGVVVDLSRTDQMEKEEHRPSLRNLQDAIIYELHVRDASIQQESGILNRGKFLGLAEGETATQNGFSTGLSYLKEFGCTHVQLLPINDFARVDECQPEKQYNWGYDPLYFQVPEGSYSVLPDRPIARINELKTMIQAFHQEGISVILDVVFNHVFNMEDSPFEKLVPGYYFRYLPNGQLSNGTGVGNDLASERRMVRKFILDTIDFLLDEYHIDGFRFDLMGALDIETMQQIEERCQKEEIPIMLLGEGWDLPTAIPAEIKAASYNASRLPGIRFFNDQFRDSIKGNLFDQQDRGFINGDGRFIERMPQLMSGSAFEEYGNPFVSDVNQTINYVECHDNHTLWDRLMLTNQHADVSQRKKMHQLATGIVLLSQGVPFIHAGQEWFRSKHGEENSYISDDRINQLDWNKREQEAENIDFIKSLITLRKEYDLFRMTSKQEIRRRFHIIEAPAPVFGFTLLGDQEDFTIYINPTGNKFDLRLPSSGKWKIAVTNNPNKHSEQTEINGEYSVIDAYELVVFQKIRKPGATGVAVQGSTVSVP